MLYQMQVIRKSDKPVLVGKPVSVFADSTTEARQKAAKEKLRLRHNVDSMYHVWLIAEMNGKEIGPIKFNPEYTWAVDKLPLVD